MMSHVGVRGLFLSSREDKFHRNSDCVRWEFDGIRPILIVKGVAQQEHLGHFSAMNGSVYVNKIDSTIYLHIYICHLTSRPMLLEGNFGE